MSYKEFVPAAQRATSFAEDDTIKPPTLATEPTSGWSPPRRGEAADGVERNGEYISAETIELSDGTSSQSGMNSSAASWIPPFVRSMPMKNYTAYDKDDQSEIFDEHVENQDYLEPMTEIMWNDNTYHVPESLAYAYEEGQGYPHSLEEDAGVEWAHGIASQPVPPKRSLLTIGIPDPIRQHFQQLDSEAMKKTNPDDGDCKDVPTRYHSIFLLDRVRQTRVTDGYLGYPSAIYKVVDSIDTQIYALRYFKTIRVNPTTVKTTLMKWFDVRHPGVVSLYSINQERGMLFFTHAYHPTAQTLKERFIDLRGPLLKESLIWRIFTQLLSALRVVHRKSLAIQSIRLQHVILTSGTVARFNNVGISDVLKSEGRASISAQQSDDLIMLGHLILSLATRAVVGPWNADEALLLLSQHFTIELHEAVGILLGGKTTAAQVCHLIADKIHDEFDNAMAASDSLHRYLRNEFESGRMLRLLVKMGFINERPEYNRAPQWSETGDRYVLKLFRDYVFHQVLSDGVPVLDAGHVVTSLNKLDCGDEEQMLLSSRDNKDLLVVSFTDVRRCLESSFVDLDQQAQQSQHSTIGKQSSSYTIGVKNQMSETFKQSAGFVGRRQQYPQHVDRNNYSLGDGTVLAVRSRNSNVMGHNGGKGRGPSSYSTSSSRSSMYANNSLMATGEGRSPLSQRSEGQLKQGQIRGQSQGVNSYSVAQQQHLLLQQEQLKLKILQQHIQQQQQQQQQQQHERSSADSLGFRYNSEQMRHSSDSYSLLQQRQQQQPQDSSSKISAHIQQQILEQSSLTHSSSIQQQLLQQQQQQRQQHRSQALYY